jgi:hypothetical protein
MEHGAVLPTMIEEFPYTCITTVEYIVTDLLKPRPTIGLWAHGSTCLAQLYLGSVLRNSV